MTESALMSHVGQLQCPLCLTWVQRTPDGDPAAVDKAVEKHTTRAPKHPTVTVTRPA